jgi:hypothetical protein
MPLNPYFNSETQTQGSYNEQALLAELVEESIKIWGQEFFYLPRVLVAKDEILGEDRLSKFEEAYPLEMYVETPQGFVGQGEFISKFGLYIEQSIQVVVSRKRWKELIGRYGRTILQERPAEGDLVYYPTMKRLFEVKYVEKETNFFQLGSLPTWKMTIELFQMASERFNTGIPAIDAFETLKTFDETHAQYNGISGYSGHSYSILNIDVPDSFGDNNKFKAEAETIVNFDEENPFGEI